MTVNTMSSLFSFQSLLSAAWRLSSIGVWTPVVGSLVGCLAVYKCIA